MKMVETEGFRPQLFILHYSFFIIHYWVYRFDKPKFKALPVLYHTRPANAREIPTLIKIFFLSRHICRGNILTEAGIRCIIMVHSIEE